MIEVLQQILSVLLNLRKGPPVVTEAKRFGGDDSFNFKQMGGGNGCRNVTIQNVGAYNIVLEDVKQTIKPGESFAVVGSERAVNEQFKVSFGTLSAAPYVDGNGIASTIRDGIIRYNTDVCQ